MRAKSPPKPDEVTWTRIKVRVRGAERLIGMVLRSPKLDSVTQQRLAASVAAGLAGMLAGGLFIAPLADWIGRKQVLLWSATFFGAMSLATAFSHSLETLPLLRFLTGIGVGVQLITIDAYITEITPKQWRGRESCQHERGHRSGCPTSRRTRGKRRHYRIWWLICGCPPKVRRWW